MVDTCITLRMLDLSNKNNFGYLPMLKIIKEKIEINILKLFIKLKG